MAKKASPGWAAIAMILEGVPFDPAVSLDGRPGIVPACSELAPMERAATLAPASFKNFLRVDPVMPHLSRCTYAATCGGNANAESHEGLEESAPANQPVALR